jgi:DivIVA domain-containing protein
MRKRKDESDVSEPAAAGAPKERLTPMDIQEKVFRSQPGLHGYNEREVDEFLDRITEELARVHADNQRLREQLAGAQSNGAMPTASAAAGQAPAGEIGGAYIAREREFLRSLATLIQEHAEAVRQDVRRAVAASPPPAPQAPPVEPVAPAQAAAPVAAAQQDAPASGTPPPRQLDPVLAGAEGGSPAPEDETIRELFWGED